MKQSFKPLFRVAALILATSSATSFAYRIPFFAELHPKFRLDGDKTLIESYVNWTFKINDNLSFVPEMMNEIILKDEEEPHTPRVDHGFVRLLLKQSNIAQIGSWSFGIDYRWRLPTQPDLQRAGSFGGFGIRPTIKNKFGRLEVMVRDLVEVYVNKEATTINVNRRNPAVKGNSMFANRFEAAAEYDFENGFKALGAIYIQNKRVAGALGGPASWSNELWQEYEIQYVHAKYTKDTTIGLSIENTLDVSPSAADKQWFQKNGTTANIKIYRAF